MVRVFGMSSLGPIQYADPQGNVFLGRDYNNGNNYSAGVAAEIDKEVRKIVDECYEDCKRILSENRDLLDLIANSLFEEETLTKEQINNLVEYGTLTSPQEEAEKVQQEQPVEETPNEGEASDDNGQETSAGNEPEETSGFRRRNGRSFKRADKTLIMKQGWKPCFLLCYTSKANRRRLL